MHHYEGEQRLGGHHLFRLMQCQFHSELESCPQSHTHIGKFVAFK